MPEITFPELADRWRRLHESRMECEATVKALKEAEDAAASSVLSWMAANGQRAASVPGMGTLSSKVNMRIHMVDHELMADFLYKRLKAAEANGWPLVDHLVLQKAAAQSEMLDWARKRLPEGEDAGDPEALNRVLNPVGFAARAVETLGFAKERGKGAAGK